MEGGNQKADKGREEREITNRKREKEAGKRSGKRKAREGRPRFFFLGGGS